MTAIRRYGTLDSTNLEALRLARAGEPGPLWIVAREQSAGRGRRGRQWISPPGNLFATWLTRASGSSAAELGFVAALAAAETVGIYAPGAAVALKWPNDVLLEGSKIGGVLLEREADALAVGIGINLAHHPEGTEFPATSLAPFGSVPEPEDALGRLAARMAAWYEVWDHEGFGPIRTQWRARAFGLGGPIIARVADGEMRGVLEDLDGDGALLIRTGAGLSRVTAADVFFGDR
jgi:BirA family biotin operon repressor/biotin-[acetyl-CoA-carboxylase] ligase